MERFSEEVKLPDGKCIVPGVIDSTTNFIEHPEARRPAHRALCGPRGARACRAGVDCGFATFAGAPTVLPAIAWASSVPSRRAPASPVRSCGHARMKGKRQRCDDIRRLHSIVDSALELPVELQHALVGKGQDLRHDQR